MRRHGKRINISTYPYIDTAMATIQKFEDLICWQKARTLTKFVYDISKFQHGIRLCDETSRLLYSFITKLKQGGKTGLQYKQEARKKDTSVEEWMAREGKVFTGRGVMNKEEAMRRGLEII